MLKKKSRRKNLSVLLIPDDDADPISFKISFRALRVLSIIAAILVVHIFTGLLYYWKFTDVSIHNKNLAKENTQLKSDNDKIHEINKIVDDYLQYQQRVKSALGIKQEFAVSDRREEEMLNRIKPVIQMMSSDNESAAENKQAGGRLNFLTQRNDAYDSYGKNVPNYLPVEGFLTTDFHESGWIFPYRHTGIDIAAKKGTPVRAAADGVILFANWTNDLGHLIIIDHLNGFVTYYGHNQALLMNEGSAVKKGDTIALLGSSGESTAPHLHFEIRRKGIPVNPKNYLLSFKSVQ